MQRLKMRPGLIAVERINKPATKSEDGFFVTPEVTQNLGVVLYAADDAADLLGKKVYFGTKREEMQALGRDLLFMEKTNVYAEVEEAVESGSGSNPESNPA